MAKLKLDGDASGAVKATEDVAKGIKKIADSSKEAGKAHDEAAKSHQHAFGEEAARELSQYVVGLVSVHKAAEVAAELFRQAAEEREKAFENVSGGLMGAGAIANVVTSQAEFNKWVGVSRDKLIGKGIFKPEQQTQAEQAAAGMAAAGLNDKEVEFMVEMGKQKRISGEEIGTYAEAVRDYQNRYGGDFIDIAKKGLYAAPQTHKGFSAAQMLQRATGLGPKAEEFGLSGDELTATLITLSQAAGTKKGAVGLVDKFFEGEFELTPAQKAELTKQTSGVRGAPRRKVQDFLAGDKRYSAARGAEESAGELAMLLEQQLGERHAIYEDILSQAQHREASQGTWPIMRGIGSMMMRGIGYFSEDAMIRGARDYEHNQPGAYSTELLERIGNYLDRQTRIMEMQNRSGEPPSGPAE